MHPGNGIRLSKHGNYGKLPHGNIPIVGSLGISVFCVKVIDFDFHAVFSKRLRLTTV